MDKYAHASPRAIPFEKFREDWQLQIIADPTLPFVTVRVALVISWHMNRGKGGLAFPGMTRLAKMARTTARTVIRATKRLEDGGHLRIMRTHKDNRRGLNRYTPLLKRFAHNLSGGSDQAVSPPSDQAVSHKPLKEPLREPLSYMASVSTDALSRQTQAKRLGEVSKIALLSAKPNHSAQCFGLVDKHWPKDRALVAKALRNSPAAEVLAELEVAVEDGLEPRDVLTGLVGAGYDAA